jgi:T4 bacteriophage base plate protein
MNNNPLKQYFRRPALYLSLPSKGQYYPPGALEMPENGELAVYPMTAIDEITSKTPDALFNGNAIPDVIQSCIPGIKNPWAIPSIDMDAILIAIRTATSGNELEINSECPSCKEESKYNINLGFLLGSIKPGDYTNDMKLNELILKFKPLTYKEVNSGNMGQFVMQREIAALEAVTDETERSKKSSEIMQKLTTMNIEIIANVIESISLPDQVVTNREHIGEFLGGCDKKTYEKVREHVLSLRESSTIKPQHIKCINCSHEYDQSLLLNVSDFFG